uniref:Uncharacterized protein n=1 Tax=Arundo donax TaxID=35708 RepID=A0A0A9C7X0_ARUDO
MDLLDSAFCIRSSLSPLTFLGMMVLGVWRLSGLVVQMVFL